MHLTIWQKIYKKASKLVMNKLTLKQLNEEPLKKLINSDKVFTKQKLLVKVIPPKQFLIDSIERRHNTKKPIWPLPYFMEKQYQIVGC